MGEAYSAVIAALGDRVRRKDDHKATSRCPAHEDQQASLSVSVGDVGNVLIHCHAGCSTGDVLSAIGLQTGDMFDDRHRGSLASAKVRATPAKRAAKQSKPPRTYPTVEAAGEAHLGGVRRKYRDATLTTYTYATPAGEPFGAVFRADYVADGEPCKAISQATRAADGSWMATGGTMPWPLYKIDTVPAEGVVTVHEGEKAALAAEVLGLVAVTSRGGAAAPSKTDWSPLAGRDVVIFPDADAAGEKYAADVAGILAALDPPARVRIARVHGLGKGGDVADLPTGTDDELIAARRAVEAALDAAAESSPVVAAEEQAIKGEVVPYSPSRTRQWGEVVVEMRWLIGGRQMVRVLRGDAVVDMAELKVATLSTRDKFCRNVARKVGGKVDELDAVLVGMLNEGCPPAPIGPALPPPPPLVIPEELDGRPVILLNDTPECRADALRRALDLLGRDHFKSDLGIVRLDAVAETPGKLAIKAINADGAAAYLDSHAALRVLRKSEGEGESLSPEPCPEWLARRCVNAHAWHDALRQINGVAYGPFMREDGSIGGMASGYDVATGVYVATDQKWPTVPEMPTKREALAARDLLLSVVKTFPFKGEPDRSVWLASLLTAAGRRAFDGPAPLFLCTSPVQGSGKSYTQQAVAVIVEGHRVQASELSRRPEEAAKMLLSLLAAKENIVVFDNLSEQVGDASLDRMLTSDSIQGRRLGRSEMMTAKNRLVPMANGNNLSIAGDLARRVLPCRLEPDTDRPETLDFGHVPFLEAVMERRPQLLAAALTVLRYGMASGVKPKRLMASFERWGRLVQAAVVAVDMPDPLDAQESTREEDAAGCAAKEFVHALWEFARNEDVSSRRLADRVFAKGYHSGVYDDDSEASERLRSAIEEVVEAYGRRGEAIHGTLGRLFRAIKDRWFDGKRVVRGERAKEGFRWHVESRGDAYEG